MSVSVDSVSYYARQRPGALACVDLESGRRWSYADLARDVDRTAAWLTAQFGPASAVRVASVARNSVTLLILHLACIRAGAIYAPLNWRLTTPELTVLVHDAQPSLLVHDADFQPPAFAGPCILSGKPSSQRVVFAKAY